MTFSPRLRATVPVIAFALVAGTIATVWSRPSGMTRYPQSAKRELSAPAAEVAVVDGETLRLAESVVRLLGVAAPARGRDCRRGDGSTFDCGAASAKALAELVRDQWVDCRVFGEDPSGRPLAICQAAGAELNQALVARGWARATSQLPALGAEEAAARAQHRGLWAQAADPKL